MIIKEAGILGCTRIQRWGNEIARNENASSKLKYQN